MKKTITTLLLAAGAFALSGCSNYDEAITPDAPAAGREASFYAQITEGEGTRAAITIDGEAFTGAWEQTDELGVLSTAPSTSSPVLGKFTYDGEAFTGTLPSEAAGAWSYLAFYPHTTVDGTLASLPFGSSRTQQGNAFNSKYDALVAEAVSHTDAEAGKDEAGNAVTFDLHRLTSILNFEIKGGEQADKVKAILLTSTNAAQLLSASTLEFDAAQGAAATAALGAEDRSNVIALTFADATAPAANDMAAFFNIPAGNYDELTLDVITATNQIATGTITRNDPSSPFVAGKLHRYPNTSGLTFAELAAPSLVWPNEDINATHEITTTEEDKLTYDAAIEITVPGGIAGLEVDITSAPLNGMGIKHLDLVREKAIPGLNLAYADLGLKCGAEILYQKATTFNITDLVPMIKLLGDTPGNHIFTVKATDLAGQTTTQDLTFSITAANKAFFNGNADLWAYTGEMTAAPAAGSATHKLEYRLKGETEWINVEMGQADDDGVYRHAALQQPEWIESTNAAGKTVYTVKPKTGILPKKTYEYQFTVDGSVVDSGEFTPAGGDVIPNGDMSNWSKKIMMEEYSITYPNAEGESFWDSGNNMFTENPSSLPFTPLCEEDQEEPGTACLTTRMLFTTIMAPGNMFMGDFTFAGFGGTVSFGKPYAWTARPVALKLRYKANVGIIDQVGANDPEGETYSGKQDRSRIFVAIVDWEKQHEVSSGMTAPTGMWDPATTSSVEEGAILGYGDLVITQTVDNWTEVILPLLWYDKTAGMPSAEKFSLVISCATSFRGDYLTGCSTNMMKVDDFEWVY